MAGFRRPAGPRAPRKPSLPSVRLSNLPPQQPEGSAIKTEPIQPTFEDFRASAYFKKRPLASYPEFLTDYMLSVRLKYVPYVDYFEQTLELGEYVRQAGSTIVDFLVVRDLPWLVLPVQGEFFHPGFGEKYQADLRTFQRLRQLDFHPDVIPLDELDLLRDAYYHVKAAVVDRVDLSKYVGRF